MIPDSTPFAPQISQQLGLARCVHRASIMLFQGLAANYERYMTLLSERQKLVASNIANVDTPGYHTQDIDFRSEFENASSGDSPTVIEPGNLATKPDGNNVDLDREARLLAENALRFQIAENFARGDLEDVKLALQDGRG